MHCITLTWDVVSALSWLHRFSLVNHLVWLISHNSNQEWRVTLLGLFIRKLLCDT